MTRAHERTGMMDKPVRITVVLEYADVEDIPPIGKFTTDFGHRSVHAVQWSDALSEQADASPSDKEPK